jgi:UDP-N-acetyl-D-mannosaminuronic acid dehydrogenase
MWSSRTEIIEVDLIWEMCLGTYTLVVTAGRDTSAVSCRSSKAFSRGRDHTVRDTFIGADVGSHSIVTGYFRPDRWFVTDPQIGITQASRRLQRNNLEWANMDAALRKICIIGMGYVGLPISATWASRGINVVGVDIDQTIVDSINAGEPHFAEPALDMLLRAAAQTGTLRATSEPEPADAFVIAVPTPLRPDRSANLDYVDAATAAIAPFLTQGNIVILESTVPVGTTQRLACRFAKLRPDLRFPMTNGAADIDVHIAHCPERVLPGRTVRELIENDRVIGGMTERCAARAEAIYKVFLQGDCFLTDAGTAELVKLTENAFRDVNIAFANELSLICDSLGLNIWRVIDLANRHPRVSVLDPGAGVGGHCIAVDPWFIVSSAPDRAKLIRTAREVNDGKPHFVVAQVRERASRFRNPIVACLGLAYKPDVDDTRESPALKITRELANAEELERILVADPNLRELPQELGGYSNVAFVPTGDAVQQADIIAVLVAHSAFKKISREEVLRRVVIDATGLFQRSEGRNS